MSDLYPWPTVSINTRCTAAAQTGLKPAAIVARRAPSNSNPVRTPAVSRLGRDEWGPRRRRHRRAPNAARWQAPHVPWHMQTADSGPDQQRHVLRSCPDGPPAGRRRRRRLVAAEVRPRYTQPAGAGGSRPCDRKQLISDSDHWGTHARRENCSLRQSQVSQVRTN